MRVENEAKNRSATIAVLLTVLCQYLYWRTMTAVVSIGHFRRICDEPPMTCYRSGRRDLIIGRHTIVPLRGEMSTTRF